MSESKWLTLISVGLGVFITAVVEAPATDLKYGIIEIPKDEQFRQCAAASEVLSMRPPSEYNTGHFSSLRSEVDLYVKASIIAGGNARGLSDEEFEIAFLRVHYWMHRDIIDSASWDDRTVDARRWMCAEHFFDLASELVAAFGVRQ